MGVLASLSSYRHKIVTLDIIWVNEMVRQWSYANLTFITNLYWEICERRVEHYFKCCSLLDVNFVLSTVGVMYLQEHHNICGDLISYFQRYIFMV